VNRRELILGLGGVAVAWPFALRAQQRPVPLVGVLRTSTAANDLGIDGFRRALQALGYVEGQNIRIEIRWADGDNKRLPALAAELAALKPNVLVANGEPAIRAVKDAAGTTPIVMGVIGDPVAAGLAQSLAHPGGNLTGLTSLAEGLVAKRLQMLLEIVPDPGCVAVMHDPSERVLDPLYWQEATAAAQTLGVVLKPAAVSSAGELEAGFAEIARQHCRALLVMSSAVYFGARVRLAELAAQHRIAASYDNRVIAAAGGLMSYGPDTADMLRRAAFYVDKILKGANPADLPIEQPTKFQLVINLKTAKALGLAVPQALLARADEVIE
jgi:putative tryptophan/tyrosine transport system substrate-binding protein